MAHRNGACTRPLISNHLPETVPVDPRSFLLPLLKGEITCIVEVGSCKIVDALYVNLI